MESDIIKEIMNVSTYIDENGKTQPGYKDVAKIWKEASSEVQSQEILEVMQNLVSYKDENGKVIEGFWNVHNIWKATSNKVKAEKIVEVIKKIATYTDEKGKIQQGSDNILNLWKSTSKELQEEKIMEIIEVLSTYTDEKGKIQQGSDNILNLWNKTSPEVKKEKFLEILKYFKDTTYKDELNKNQVQIKNLLLFLSYTPKEIIEENYEAICEMALAFENKNDYVSRTLIYSLPQAQDLNEETIKRINEKKLIARINLKQLTEIKDKIEKGVPVYLEVKDVSELSLEKIEQLKSEGINIQYVGFEKQENQDLNRHQCIPYNIEKYEEIRKKIDELLENVDKDGNKDKILLQILEQCTRASFDNSADFNCSGEERYEKFFSSRNLEGVLLNGTCVCAGYTEAVRNMAACRGIEALFISSGNHAWNQVNLDGTWYNIDATWDRTILKSLSAKKTFPNEKNLPKYLFKSNKEFQIKRNHRPKKNSNSKECVESMPPYRIIMLMYSMINEEKFDFSQISEIDKSIYANDLFSAIKTSDLKKILNTLYKGIIPDDPNKNGEGKVE